LSVKIEKEKTIREREVEKGRGREGWSGTDNFCARVTRENHILLDFENTSACPFINMQAPLK